MGFSIQTNVNSMNGQENLRINQEFQSRTINRLTSGYRINSASDDAAGLSVANKYRNDVTSLMQGVRNANDGISTLQIVDGGLNNISKILDRMTTLATQAATDTFEGDREILQDEYATLIGEINRQAGNIGLSSGAVEGRYNKNISVYIGGGQGVEANAQVSVDLSGDKVNATGLGLSASIDGDSVGSGFATGIDLNAVGALLDAAGATQTLAFNFAGAEVDVTVTSSLAAGLTSQEVLDQINSQISSYGITASISTEAATIGELQFSGDTAFTVTAGAATAGGQAIATASEATYNTSLNQWDGQATYATVAGGAEALEFTIEGVSGTVDVSLANGTTLDQALVQLNASLNSEGVYALKNAAGTGIEFQSEKTFSVAETGTLTATGAFAVAGPLASQYTEAATSGSATSNALNALEALQDAVTALSTVQGKVGSGLNKLQYSIQLAQSQISNFSAAESRIRDADVAQEAANLTKAQVLQQASMAAMAQANSAPQSILALLRG